MIELKDLHAATLQPEEVRQLARDLRAAAERIQVLPKAGAQRYVLPQALSLEAGVEALVTGELYGLQLRYLHQGQEWWDTLLPDPAQGGFRIVRVAHS